MNDNNNNKGNNKQGYKKKFYPKKKWNNNKNKNHNEPKNQEELLEEELVENVELTEENVVEVETQATEETVENEEKTTEVVEEKGATPTKKFVKEAEDEKEDFNKPEDINEEYLKIEWQLHDKMKLSTDFHRGCRLKAEEYSVGSNVLRHSQCKLDSFNWLKDYHDTAYEGELKVAEIRFKNDRKDFYSYPTELELIEGELVAVETAIGHDIGIVTMVGSLVEKQRKRKGSNCPVSELKKIYRRARVADVEKFLESTRQEERTLYRSREIALNLNLDMKLNDIEYQGDRTKAIFYYTADGRVDFRELIKKLAEEFHIRVEMRQIGFRQESAKLGGIGSCGRELCCSSWITNFQSVTTNVARIQQLSPNPQKLAGQCGKLKCCLNYEYDTYVDALKSFPDNHINLKTKKGEAFYQKSDIFKGLMWYSYVFDRGNMLAIPAEKVKEIIDMNNKGKFPEQLEDYAFSKEQRNTEYGEEGHNVDLSKLE
jgi:cell fate regulator YaaT (PSP1 superfamily)